MSLLRDRLARLKSGTKREAAEPSVQSAAGLADGLAAEAPSRMPEGMSTPTAEPGIIPEDRIQADGERARTAEAPSVDGSTRTAEAPSVDGTVRTAEDSTVRSAGADWDRLSVYLVDTEAGTFLRRRVEYPAEYRHGFYTFGALMEAMPALSELAGGRRAPIEPERMLFLDTETTGLGVGAGNVPFMIGIGLYEDGKFCVEQLFIRHPGEEAAMLAYLAQKLSGCSAIVSYNGRTFDWPVIKNRFVMNRLRPIREEPLHLDFLYPSRSLWKHTLESCRLSRVEEDRLGIRREHDVPGSLAPSLYFQYLAEHNVEVLRGVFEHNETDIMTLATLAVHLAKAASGELSTDGMEAEEAYRLGLWLEKLGRTALAKQVIQRLCEREDDQLSGHFNELAAFFKRNGSLETAVTLWDRGILHARDKLVSSMEPYIELAMYYEHKAKDFVTALGYAVEAKELLVRRRSLLRGTKAGLRAEEEQLKRRIERLERKLAAQHEEPSLRNRSSVSANSVSKTKSNSNSNSKRQTLSRLAKNSQADQLTLL